MLLESPLGYVWAFICDELYAVIAYHVLSDKYSYLLCPISGESTDAYLSNRIIFSMNKTSYSYSHSLLLLVFNFIYMLALM